MKDLIHKFLSDTITDIEKETLRDWLKQSKNKKNFEAHVRDTLALNMLYNNVDADKAFNKILSNIEQETKVIPLYKRSILKYVAAILIFVSAGYFFLTKEHNTPIIVNNNIKTGTDKATLTLEDGTDIILEKGQEYITDNLESNGEEIIYKSTGKYKPEIAYNYLTIPRGGQYHIKLTDETEVWLNSESKLKYPVNFIDGEPRQVELVYGEAYFDVSSSMQNNGAHFFVITKNQEVEVLGTQFNIKAYKEESFISTTLVEGKVSVKNDNIHPQAIALTPSYQLKYNTLNNEYNVALVDLYSEVSWKDGFFKFKDTPLKEIMVVLSRWYDIDVEFKNKNLENMAFTGSFNKKQKIENILSVIEKTQEVSYSIDGMKVVLQIFK